MIITTFCAPHVYDSRAKVGRVCNLCLIKQGFHSECIEAAKEHNNYLICIECVGFIQIYSDDEYGLFEIIRIKS